MSEKIISHWYIYQLLQARQSLDIPSLDNIHQYVATKTCLRGFWQSETQTSLLNYSD